MKNKSTKEQQQSPGTKTTKRMKRLSEYGKQLAEKQKVRKMYGVRERQFARYFKDAIKSQEASGERLLSLLERRLDNVLYRLKLATSRAQARQIIVHGHILVNGKKVYSPSFLVNVGNQITLAKNVVDKAAFLAQVVDKRLNIGIKVPEWLELDKKDRKGNVVRLPVRSDVPAQIEEHLIVELYSK